MKRIAAFAVILLLVRAAPAAAEISQEVIDRAKPAVVALYVDEKLQLPAGTGYFISGDGDLLTALHVAKTNQFLWGKLYNGKKIKLEAVDNGGYKDIVLMKTIEDSGARPFHFLRRAARKLTAGDDVAAIGHGGGPWNSIQGSAKDVKNYSYYAGAYTIAYEPTILGGFSGGPLINADGDYVGVNVTSGDPGKVISSDLFRSRAVNLEEIDYFLSESAKRNENRVPVLGMILRNFKARGPAELLEKKGVWVERVAPGSVAERIGIRAGDVIVKIGNRLVGGISDFREIIAGLPASIAAQSDAKTVVLEIMVTYVNPLSSLPGAVIRPEVPIADLMSANKNTPELRPE